MTLTATRARPRAEQEISDALGKTGWAARGALYVVTGLLASRIATGGGSEEASHDGALHAIAAEPFGKGMLAALTVGLLAYACWRLVEAWRDRGNRVLDRLEHLGSAIVYLALAIGATSILFAGGSGGGGGGGEQKAKGLTAAVLGWPMGPWLVGLAGVVIAVVGVQSLVRGLSRDFMGDIDVGRVPARRRQVIEVTGIFGQSARGVVFGLIAWFVVKAAVEFDPQEARGLDGALHELAATPEGPALLWAAALGLVAFGLFCLLRARYGRATR